MSITPEAALAEARRRADAGERFWAWNPLPKSDGQNRFIAAITALAAMVFCLIGGNRSGKSECGGWSVAWYVLNVLPEIQRQHGKLFPVWVIGRTSEECGEIIWKQKLRQFIPKRDIAAIAYHSKAKDWPSFIRTVDGVEIHFKATEQGREAFQGSSIGLAWFDEQFPEDIFSEVQTRCIEIGAPIIITLTPVRPDPFLQQRYDEPPSGWAFFEISIDDNRRSRGGYLPDSEVDKAILEWPEELRETRRHGKFAGFTGAVFKTFRRSVHVVNDADDPLFRRISRDWRRACGVDFGSSNPMCVIWGCKDADGRWILYDEHYKADQLLDLHIPQIRAKIHEHGWDGKPEPISAWWADPADAMALNDPAWKTSARLVMSEAGFHCSNPDKSVSRGIEEIQKAMTIRPDGTPGLLISGSRCPNLVKQLGSYRYQDATANKNAPGLPVKKDDHSVDAARYLIASEARQGVGFGAVARIPGADRIVMVPGGSGRIEVEAYR